MALGGGTYLVQNKILPGAYINFISAARASATLSERGIATIPVIFDWGPVDTVFEVTTGDFQKKSQELFGYDYTAPELAGLRDMFKNIRKAYLYRLGQDGTKAACNIATAKYEGIRGNDITVTVSVNLDDIEKFDVATHLGSTLVDRQIGVDGNTDSLAGNLYVDWKADVELEADIAKLTGGASPVIANGDYQTYLDRVEQYTFNAIGCPSNDVTLKGLFTAFTKRLRDEQGVKFQCVTYDNAADYEGIVNVPNKALGDVPIYSAVYWTTGVIAGTDVNKSATNKIYDGEFSFDVNYTQSQLEDAVKTGKFIFHRVNGDVRVLRDINSLVNTTLEKGEDFKQNQTIRVLDQIGNDIAVLFNSKYLGVYPNDNDGRISFWADIVKHHEQLQSIRAIEGFTSDGIIVTQGDLKRSVVVTDNVTPVNAMEQLYMEVRVN